MTYAAHYVSSKETFLCDFLDEIKRSNLSIMHDKILKRTDQDEIVLSCKSKDSLDSDNISIYLIQQTITLTFISNMFFNTNRFLSRNKLLELNR